jgi:hypothetical protein
MQGSEPTVTPVAVRTRSSARNEESAGISRGVDDDGGSVDAEHVAETQTTPQREPAESGASVDVDMEAGIAPVNSPVGVSPVEDMTTRLLWARLHELETLKGRMVELTVLLQRAGSLCGDINASVDRDLDATLRLAETCLAGRVEIRSRASFSEMFTHLIAHLYQRYNVDSTDHSTDQ